MGVLERLEEQRRYEIHQRKLARTRNVVKTQEKEKRLLKKFDPDTLATANRQRAPRSPAGFIDEDDEAAARDGGRRGSEQGYRQPEFDDPLQPQDSNRPQRRVSSASRRKQAKADAHLAQPRERAERAPSREEVAKQRLQDYAEAELQARGARKTDAQERITQRQEAALQKYHRRRTGEKEDDEPDPKDAAEQKRLAAARRKQRQAAAERNEAALEKHRARQRTIREGKAVAAANVARISTAPEQREARQPREPRAVRGAPRVANLDAKPKAEKRWVTVAEASTPSPVGKGLDGTSKQADAAVAAVVAQEEVLSARAQKYSHEDRRALIDRLEAAEQTIVHLRQRVHDLETRQVVKPTEVADDDALEAALARALAAEVALENGQAELSTLRDELASTHQDKQSLEQRLEAAAANVAAADDALLAAQLTTAPEQSASEDTDTVQYHDLAASEPRRQDEPAATATDGGEHDDDGDEEAFEDDFEDEEEEEDDDEVMAGVEPSGSPAAATTALPSVERTPVAAPASLLVPDSIKSIQGSIGGWTPEA